MIKSNLDNVQDPAAATSLKKKPVAHTIGKSKSRVNRKKTKKRGKQSKSSKKKANKNGKKNCVKFKVGNIIYKPPMNLGYDNVTGKDMFSKGKVGTVVSISKNCKWYLVIFNTGRGGIGMYSPKFHKGVVIATDVHKRDNPPNSEDPPLDSDGVEDARREFHKINDNRDV